MPFSRPTLAKIRSRTTSDFEYELGAQAARIPGTPERGFVEATAGTSHGLHGRLAWIAKNAFLDTMEDDRLIKFAGFFGITAISATRAEGTVEFVGTNGTDIPIGTIMSRADGAQYEVIVADTVAGGVAEPTVRALAEYAGEIGNTDTGVTIVLANPIVGINSEGGVGLPIEGGTDEETTLALRNRLRERLANPPNSGGPGSYIAWAKEIAGVTRVWEYGGVPSLGHVTVLFVRDNDEAGPDPDYPLFPSDAEVDEVEAKILEYAPIHLAGLHVQSPVKKTQAFTIELTPNGDADLEAAVTQALKDKLAEVAEPPAADGATFYKSHFYEALSTVEGLDDFKITVPSGDVTVDQYELVVVGTITWL